MTTSRAQRVPQVVALDAERLRTLAAQAASVYGAAMRRSPETVVARRDLIAVHAGYPGLVAAAAMADGPEPGEARLVGFGYGYLGAPGQWWHDVVVGALGPAAAYWLEAVFELAELHVHPDRQGVGLGRALLADILSRARGAHILLSTPDVESPARSLYRSVGFDDLRVGFCFPGSNEPYAIMGKDL
jgi:GNAT superfamily N-acetyltransferase